jgi:hypothetical protein
MKSSAVHTTTPGISFFSSISIMSTVLTMADDEEQEVMDLGKNECAASIHRA